MSVPSQLPLPGGQRDLLGLKVGNGCLVSLRMQAASPMAAAAALLRSPHARSLPARHTAALERLCELNEAGFWFAELGELTDVLLAACSHPLRLELLSLTWQLVRRAPAPAWQSYHYEKAVLPRARGSPHQAFTSTLPDKAGIPLFLRVLQRLATPKQGE